MTDTATMQRDEQIIYIKTYDLWHRVRAKGRVTEFGDNNEVHLGFFRYYDYTKKDDAGYGGDGLAIWLDRKTGDVVAAINGKEIKNHYNVFDDGRQMWLSVVLMSCAQDAVSEDYYFTRTETGTWPDQDAAVTKLAEENRERIGGNNPPPEDSFEGLEDSINKLHARAEELIKEGAAKTKEAADGAGDLKAALTTLYNKADKAKDTEKNPHWEKCKQIENKWRPLRTMAEIHKRLWDVVIAPYQIAEKRRLAEETRKAQEEAARLQREAEAAQRKADEEAQRIADDQARAAQAGVSSPEDDKQAQDALEEAAREADRIKKEAAEAAYQAEQAAKQTPKVGGQRGRAIGLRTTIVPQVADRKVAASSLKNDPLFLTALDKLLEDHASRILKDGIRLDGFNYVERQTAG